MAQLPIKSRDKARYYATVDDDMAEELSEFNWHLSNGYAATSMKDQEGKPRTVLMHRYVIGAQQGEITDHINRIKLDNRRENLRLLTTQQNLWNRGKASSQTTSSYIGVSRYGYDSPYWEAQITVDGQKVRLGKFLDEEEAAYVYDQAAMQLRGEYASLNFEY